MPSPEEQRHAELMQMLAAILMRLDMIASGEGWVRVNPPAPALPDPPA